MDILLTHYCFYLWTVNLYFCFNDTALCSSQSMIQDLVTPPNVLYHFSKTDWSETSQNNIPLWLTKGLSLFLPTPIPFLIL